MNSEVKTDKCDKWCPGCEEFTDELEYIDGHNLCSECADIYDNKTGYCSLHCCLGGECDGSC